jgi:hypothetical protein
LTARAKSGGPIEYEAIAQALNREGGNWYRYPLELIQDYVEHQGLAPLTTFVVKADTGLPGPGCHPRTGDWKKDWELVRAEDWTKWHPTAADFLEVRATVKPDSKTGENWTAAEVRATVESYFEMLNLELGQKAFKKSDHRARLMERVPGRSKASLEFKLQNISAVLDEQGLPWIKGYKPASNYQALLAEEVRRFLDDATPLAAPAEDAPEPSAPDLSRQLADIFQPPPAPRVARPKEPVLRPSQAAKVDYAAREARNRKLGLAGEEFIVEMEKRRLRDVGRDDLVGQVSHVSAVQGDGLGYDVKSFSPDGKPVFIEVKTTRLGPATPFFMTPAELAFAVDAAGSYRLARVYNWGALPCIFELDGKAMTTLQTEPSQFRCRF